MGEKRERERERERKKGTEQGEKVMTSITLKDKKKKKIGKKHTIQRHILFT